MKKYCVQFFFVFVLSFSGNSFAQSITNILDLKLMNSDNIEYKFSELKKSKATVIVFFLTDCPASQNYTLTINKLQKKYSDKNISFDIIFPDTYSSLEEVRKFKIYYKIKMHVLLDSDLTLTKLLQAKVAPQCFLLDSFGKIIYEGRIDDWYFKPGKKRTVILTNDLDIAISKFLSGKPVKPSKTIPVGCVINY